MTIPLPSIAPRMIPFFHVFLDIVLTFFENTIAKNNAPKTNLKKIYKDADTESESSRATTKVLPQINVVANNANSALVLVFTSNPASSRSIPVSW